MPRPEGGSTSGRIISIARIAQYGKALLRFGHRPPMRPYSDNPVHPMTKDSMRGFQKTFLALMATHVAATCGAAELPAGWIFSFQYRAQPSNEIRMAVDNTQLSCGTDKKGRDAVVYLGYVGNILSSDGTRGGALKLQDVTVMRPATDVDTIDFRGKPSVISAVSGSPVDELMAMETANGEKWVTWVGKQGRPVFDCYTTMEGWAQVRPIPAIFKAVPDSAQWKYLGMRSYDAAGFAAVKAADARAAKLEQEARDRAAASTAAELAQWRRTIASGDKTSCGLVVEIKPKVVSVQTRDRGLVWVQREQLRQPGAGCDM
jgi:hypothetical protein